MRLIDADKLKQHYAWWNDENKELFDTIVDAQPTVEPDASVKAKRVDFAGRASVSRRRTNIRTNEAALREAA